MCVPFLKLCQCVDLLNFFFFGNLALIKVRLKEIFNDAIL